MIVIKSAAEIQKMRASAELLMRVMQKVAAAVKPGITTAALDKIAYDEITRAGATPSFLNYHGFPASICASVNEEIVHGIPSKKRRLVEGDIVGIDLGACLHGYHSDMARTVPVGNIAPEVARLVEVTRECFFKGCAQAVPGNRIFHISQAVQQHAEENGYSVVRELVGHGIGQQMHEDPDIPNFVSRRKGPTLRPGMALAIEPMINLGVKEVCFLDDGWTTVTADGKPSAHYENTIMVTDGEPEILTLER